MELPTEGLGQQPGDPAFDAQDEWGETGEPDEVAEVSEPVEWDVVGEAVEVGEPVEVAGSGEAGEWGQVAESGEAGEWVEVAESGGQRPATGEPRVDAALARLDELAGRPVTEHRAIFEDVHRRLKDVLGELDTRDQAPPENASGAGRRAGR
jgi:hypothetical protein